MLKIFTTQLSGLFKRIHDQEEEAIEDGARMLAQSAISGHTVYIYGKNEFSGIAKEAIYGRETLPYVKEFPEEIGEITPQDKVLMFLQGTTEQDELDLVRSLHEQETGIIAVSTEGREAFENYCDVWIDTKLKKPLVPDDTGERIGYPSLMAGLYVYHALALTLKEILDEYE
ncbi:MULTISPECIES: DUF2529 domain-containing protein [Bacillus]|uniref:DUF2529 domain-containing protein n=3 Tax=Bacillus TaxID=1386 RepID=A0A0M4FSJ7_9BACI|nr:MULTISPECIES: DUF2529 domain-containing protein [Bacillus]ALC82760.1 hypothetical protein AM592_15085 [Bacillus gobiensis]MBP1081714.1 hypothetical protein [Bacillus capparidis]MED1096367.1 DUF2529 domain-containing protein [Bacillus capparidis]